MTKSLRFSVSALGCLLFLVLALLEVSTSCRAQTTTASLEGTVGDASGARLPGATVTVVNTGTGLKETATSDVSGFFTFSQLPVGNYVLKVVKPGFEQYVQSGMTLTVGQAGYVAIALKVGSTVSEVTVTSNVPLVDTQTPTNNQLVQGQQAQDLPLNGRDSQDLVNITPGTYNVARFGSPESGQGAFYPDEGYYAVNGALPMSVNYQMDGVDHNDTYLNASLPFPNPDAIQEFGIQSANFSAEYGNAAGGVVNIISKSGTNRFHGDAFEFLRNGSLNAKNYFGTTHDSLHRNQFGGTMGGPIFRNKLFFFGSYQRTPTSSASSANVTFVPTAAERTGDFSAITKQLYNPFTGAALTNNQIAPGNLDPTAVALLKYVPLPNGANGQLTYTGLATRTFDTQALGRLDYTRGKHQFSGHYFYSQYSQPVVAPSTNILAATNGGNLVTIQTVDVSHTYARSANLLFNSTFGWNSQTGGSASSAPFSWSTLGANIAHGNPPELYMSITSGFGVNTGHLGTFDRGDYTVREDVTKIVGRHELHLGGQALRVSNTLINTYRQSGYWTFSGQLSGNGLSDFMFGDASGFQQGAGQFKNFAGVQWALFAQDNWRASNRLTIDLGLRWDPWLPYYDRQGRTVCWVPGAAASVKYPNAPSGMIFGGDAGCPEAGSVPYWPQFGPRVGFAYRVTQSGSTSVRGGFGIYYTPVPTTDYNAMATTAPFAPLLQFTDVDFTNPYQSIGIPDPFPAGYGPATPSSSATFTLPTTIGGVFNKGFRPGQTKSYNLIVEHQIGKSAVARIAYFGNASSYLSDNTSLGVQQQLDAAVYIPGNSTEANEQSRRPYLNFTSIKEQVSSGIANYNGLQGSFEVRLGGGQTINTSYTWSKALDDVGWDDPYNEYFDYGPSSQDLPNNAKFSDAWTIPAPHANQDFLGRLIQGWQVNSIVLWQSGTPLTINSGVDNSFSGVGSDHANYLGGPIAFTSNRSHASMAKEWFNTAAFGPNTVGTFGTASKGQVYNPRYFDTDLALVKNTAITESIKLQLRFEAFNAFNNVDFESPNTNQSSSSFGQITSAGSPRILQLGTKIEF